MTASANPVAVLNAVGHWYGKAQALDNITLEVPAGCLVGLIGPDGVGKSTVLGLLAGAKIIQSGSVTVFDGDIGNHRYRNSISPRIAFMPQGLGKNLYATLSVQENIDFFGRLFGLGPAERARKTTELLKATGLDAFSSRPAGKLSGGMKQKLGLCCALIHDPDLLILDEPTTGIDPLSRRQFWELVERIRQRHPSMSVIVATAYMDEAERFDWLIPMNAGRVLDAGTARTLKERTGSASLEEAFIRLLPEEMQNGHQALSIPPLSEKQREIAISAKGLTKRFGQFVAVDGVDLDIHRGEIFGFVGSNGCGKTTTMKMLTGLLPVSEGEARLFGQVLDARAIEVRRRVGYMSQAFSLYEELTVYQNLELHAKLFHLPEAEMAGRLENLLERFHLRRQSDKLAGDLPLGIRQRLSLAVAVVHDPDLLILDEPTSGVDPVARDQFWRLLVELSRQQGVTIFVSTHFMNEAERCDRISLMHAGRILVTDTPSAIQQQVQCDTLEDAFIVHLESQIEQADELQASTFTDEKETSVKHSEPNRHLSLRRLLGYSHRELLEVIRDPIRMVFALLGSALLMLVLGYGITMDVEDLPFAVLDRDQTPASRDYIQNIAGSRYFVEKPPLADYAELDLRLRNGDLTLAVEIPPGFGSDLKRGRSPQVAIWVDGAMPFRAETVGGYVQGLHLRYLTDLSIRTLGYEASQLPAELMSRYRFNQDFKSIYAMVPAVVPLLLMFIPSILTALAVVREKELGSIVNLYVSPANRLEFLVGKQLPYILLSMVSFLILVLVTVYQFEVPIKGSLMALFLAAFIFVVISTGIGLLMSTVTRTQVAALAATALLTMITTVNFSGLIDPLTSLEGAGRVIGEFWPATYFITIVRGVYTKALGMTELAGDYWRLMVFVPVIMTASILSLGRQSR